MSLCSKTHATQFPRCYAHGGFNNRIPTTISQACYRNPRAVMSGSFLYSSFASRALRMMKDVGGIANSSPTNDALRFPRQSSGQIPSRNSNLFHVIWQRVILVLTLQCVARGRGLFCKGSNAQNVRGRAFRIPISRHDRRPVMPISFASYMLHIRMPQDYTRARGLVRIRHKRYKYICIYLRALQDIRNASGENFIKEANARFFSLSSFRGSCRLS